MITHRVRDKKANYNKQNTKNYLSQTNIDGKMKTGC